MGFIKHNSVFIKVFSEVVWLRLMAASSSVCFSENTASQCSCHRQLTFPQACLYIHII